MISTQPTISASAAGRPIVRPQSLNPHKLAHLFRKECDVPMRDCSITLDNDMVLDHGRFRDEKMRVARVPR